MIFVKLATVLFAVTFFACVFAILALPLDMTKLRVFFLFHFFVFRTPVYIHMFREPG